MNFIAVPKHAIPYIDTSDLIKDKNKYWTKNLEQSYQLMVRYLKMYPTSRYNSIISWDSLTDVNKESKKPVVDEVPIVFYSTPKD